MIKVLDKFTADKIAAGEVIERPVSAVKELIENSIDAGAGSIIVEIRGGGKSYIRVTDDGCGIPADETETAFLRHATSKISGISDLDSIVTLGFRGEALASISAVSKLTLVTRTSDRPAGVRLMLHGGKVISRESAGANTGTTIVVEDLFYNTPARRKFMGTDAREGSAVIELIEQYAVCYAGIRFMMIRNGETVFTTSGDGDALSAIRRVYPDTAHAGLIPVSGRNVTGYVSDPGTTRNTRKGQLFFVNGRLVSSPVIEKALVKGYGGRIFSGFPIAILFITADPHDIDVNIHPGKLEIRFLRQDEIISDIAGAVEDAMTTRASVPSGPSAKAESPAAAELFAGEEYISEKTIRPAAPEKAASEIRANDRQPAADHDQDYYRKPEISESQPSIRDFLSNIVREVPAEYAPVSAKAPDTRRISFDDLVFKGYIFDTYIIMESDDAIYMFDQHAAHERINYEKFRSAYLSSEQLPQPVLTPVTISLSSDVYYMGRDMLEPLHRMGYDINDFGMGTFVIRGVPAYVTMTEAVDFAQSYFDSLEDSSGVNDAVIDKLIMRSCKASVKGGEKLSRMEIDELMRDLASCRDPYACPHGRPTFVRTTKYEIERSFRRK